MALYARQYDTSPAIRRQFKRSYIAVIVMEVCIFLLVMSALDPWSWIGAGIIGALVAVMIIAYPRIHRRQWLKSIRCQIDVPDNAGTFKPRTMTFDDGCVTVTTDVANSTLQWSAFIKAEETPERFFLSTSAQFAHVIPKRAMTETQIAELTQLLNNKIKK